MVTEVDPGMAFSQTEVTTIFASFTLQLHLSLRALLIAKLPKGFEGPSQIGSILRDILDGGFWTFIKTVEILILAIFDTISASLEAAFNAISAEWKLGFISDLWKELLELN